jgi:hypothetical protein
VTARELARSVAHYQPNGPLGPVTSLLFVVSFCLVLFLVLPPLSRHSLGGSPGRLVVAATERVTTRSGAAPGGALVDSPCR